MIDIDGRASEKTCPKCGAGTRLIVRKNRQNGSYFLGCPRYPECDYTESLPEGVRMKLLGHPTLF